MTTPISDLLKCPQDGGGNTGILLCSARVVCGTSPTISTDNGFASITRNGTGDYTLGFEQSFASAPFGWLVAEGSSDTYNAQLHSQPTTSSMRVLVYNDAGSAADPTAIHAFALGA